LPTVPYTPTEFHVIPGDQLVSLTWEEPSFNGNSTITKYEISAMPDPKTNVASDVFSQTEDLEFTFDGLVNGITYKFQVNAVNEIGSGIKSEIITGTPFGVSVPLPTPAPIPTSNEKITLCHNNKVTLSLPNPAVNAHLKNHDDYLGDCLDNSSLKEKSDKTQREADRLAQQEAKRLQLESDKAQKESDKLAKLETKKQQSPSAK